ncbi:MAG: uroporphyrinogen-III synthase [Bacteroidales bacterium]|nr:uroporphyrinogen-III synthase [Bacteroidales bacterium]
MRIKNILFSQNPPQNFDKTPYAEYTRKYNVKVNFFKFFQSEEITVEQFRKKRVNFSEYTAVILTSKKVVDHFFSLKQKMKLSLPAECHFYCINEAVAFYLQKYIVFRKRKVFYGKGEPDDLLRLLEENDEKYLYPCGVETIANTFGDMMDSRKISYRKIEVYHVSYADLLPLELDKGTYDMLVFFSPHGVDALKRSYPEFEQGDIMIGALGTQVVEKVQQEGLRLDVSAPTPEHASIFTAIDCLLQKTNGRKR